MRFYSTLFLLTLVTFSPTPAWTAPGVVASIKPVHALLSHLMQGVAEPALLMAASQSPHHYSLKPSERRLLTQADLIFWIGPGMESFMPRLVETLDKNTVVVPLMKTSGLVLLPLRSSDEHMGDHGHATHDERHDPHIWLNTHNMEVMADEMTRQLVKADPEHKTQYENNNSTLKQQIARLRENLNRLFDGTTPPFLTYHDGYQYFENEFGLNNAGFISPGSEFQPGAGHISELKKRLKQQSIPCVFYEALVKPPLLKSLLSDSNARAIALDATGMTFPAGKNNLFQVMQSLGENISTCLQTGR